MNLTWYAPIAYAGLLLGLLPFALIALVTQKKMTVHAGICAEHRRRRRNAILVGLLGVTGGIGVMIIGGLQDSGWILLAGLVGILATLIYLTVAARIIWPKKITRELAWIKGVSPEYLGALPEFPEP